MDVELYNTLSRTKEKLVPLHERVVKIYQCGPTVYWSQHIGNMRAIVIADVLVRMFKYVDYDVTFVRNYTDVGHLSSDNDEGEDKMSKGAKREALTPGEIAKKYTTLFEADAAELNTLSPNFTPRATGYVSEMIALATTLIKKNYAYITPLAVYFYVSKAKDYTRLSGQVLENNIVDAGQGTVGDPNKKNPEDFSIWFFKAGVHENALQTWPNPFSNKEGFPGWHIECSAMIKKLLGDTIDIHMGGIEHIPVHHTNEIAQSESANEKPLAQIWMHNEHLLVDSKKMAKSVGTSYTISDIKDRGFSPASLRYLFLNAHYKSKQNFTWQSLEGAQTALQRLESYISAEIGIINVDYKKRFTEIITNDLDTPRALALAWEVAKDESLSAADKTATLLDFDKVLGLGLAYRPSEKIPTEIQELVTLREEARRNKDWKKSDDLRSQINSLGYEILNTEKGPKISKLEILK